MDRKTYQITRLAPNYCENKLAIHTFAYEHVAGLPV
jgi:hypothetical protein